MSEATQMDAPVTRREFSEELDKISSKIDELVKAKQVSWPLILGVAGLALTVLGFGVKNLADVASVSAKADASEVFTQDARERIRALEANTHAILVENETQNRWMADVVNLQYSHLETLIRTKHPDTPPASYYPLGKVGGANVMNGKH